MSHSANPNKPRKEKEETEAAAAARQEKADRERIRRLIITLGDDNKKVVGQIRGLAGALDDDVELHGDLLASTLLECAQHLPLKSCIYSAWVSRMADNHPTWVSSIIEKALDELRAALRVGDLATSQLLLRFLVGLGSTGTLGLSSVMALLQEVLALSDGLMPAKGGDLGVFLALASLLYLSPAGHAKVVQDVDRIIAGASTYLASRDARWKPLLRILKSHDLPDRLEALILAVRSQKEAGWASESVLFVPGFEPSLAGKEGCKLSPLGTTADDIKKSKVRLQVPLVTSRLLTSKLGSGNPDEQFSKHDTWILEDYIVLTMDRFGRDIEECCKQILRIPVLHPHFESIAVETVFSQMLRLPTPPLLPLFYSRLLEAMMDKQKSTTALVDQAYKVLFEESPEIDEECLEVLAESFAYHLIHNGYQADWSPFTGDSVAVQAQRLLRRSLERLQRLSFHQNLLHRLPEAVHVYVPPEPLAVSNLPVHAKPEFARMLGIARIKEPNEQKVLKYCHRLLKTTPKEELKEEEDERASGGGTAVPVVNEAPKDQASAADEALDKNGAEAGGKRDHVEDSKEDAVDGSAPESKRPRSETGATAEPDATAETEEASKDSAEKGKAPAMDSSMDVDEKDKPALNSGENPNAGTSVERSRARDKKMKVKEEDKPEDDHGEPGVATAKDLKEKPEDDHDELGEVPADPWTLDAMAELFVVAVLQNGSKTPTHMNKMLDGHQNVFGKLRPTEEDEAHSYAMGIVRCIFEFWRHSGQRLEITLDTLLHRGIVTPRAIVEQALAQRGPHGSDSMSAWNVINTVARKSLEHSQSVRGELFVAKRLGKTDVVDKCRRQLDSAIHETAELFTLIFTGLVRNYQDFEETDILLRKITLDRVLTIGRKYHAFIKPLIEQAESRIPGVAHNPDIAAIFHSLGSL